MQLVQGRGAPADGGRWLSTQFHSHLLGLLARLTKRDSPRTEADIQSDVRQFFLTAPFQLDEGDVENVLLESPLGDRRRIDVEVGSTVVEVKRDLRKGRVREEALEQLAGYVETRASQTGRRYVGVLTDGVEWCCYNLANGHLAEVSSLSIANIRSDLERLTVWLEGVLATAKGVTPSAREIAARLGAGSSAHALDSATLATLYRQNSGKPSIQMKRALWSRLLTSALGTQFDDDDALFIEHTLLVNSAEIIAHALLGLLVEDLNPASLLSGAKFDESGIHGVVEQDFFDWVIEVEGGKEFVRTLARRLVRFDWASVDQDVLKVLYESIIGKETRKRLGEYYTPDWLAERMVDDVIADPLNVRVLDTACGSGTFLFHAVRKYVKAAESSSASLPAILDGVTGHVLGMDLHPVAVTLARVTYLLAIGKERLTDPARGSIQIPVYLGDSIQWQEQQLDLWTAGNLVIRADDRRELFASELRFPDKLLENAALFDQLIQELADRAAKRKPGDKVPGLAAVFRRLGIPESLQPTIEKTFRTMCRLHDEGRDHIWGYYVRNLARPMWLAREPNRVDILIGNPPWLAYRHMTAEMQETFRRMSESRGLWQGAEVATHQDLAGLFVARTIQLYLKKGGRFAMVMPNAAVDRAQYSGFRKGDFPDMREPVAVEFGKPWDLRRIRPHFFPRGASVVFGTRSSDSAVMPREMEVWSGRVARENACWSEVKDALSRQGGKATIINRELKSPYRARFNQGAIFAPRLLFLVTEKSSGPLGLPAGKLAVISSRSANEKKPWKELSSVEGVVESEFVRPLYTGESVLPYRTTKPEIAVIPWTGSQMLTSEDEIDLYPGLSEWWKQAEGVWETHRSSQRLTLREQLDYRTKLSNQFPIPHLRVVYNTSGMHLAAAKIENRRAVISSGLYWAAVESEDEADYLCAILNSPVTTELLRPYMSYGKDERHVHKHVWQLPIPAYSETDAIHARLADLGRQGVALANKFSVDESLHFAATRRHIRQALADSEIAREIDEIVYEFLS